MDGSSKEGFGFKWILGFIVFAVAFIAIACFTSTGVIAVSSWLMALPEIWVAFFTGLFSGVSLGIIFAYTRYEIRCKYCVDNWSEDTERSLGKKILEAMEDK